MFYYHFQTLALVLLAGACWFMGPVIFVCGGNWYGYTYSLSDCYKLDLDEYNPSWQTFTQMPLARKHFTLDVYDDYM